MKHGGTPIRMLMDQISTLKGQDEVALMDGGGRMSASDVAKLRQLTCRLIWSKRPELGIRFMDKDHNMSDPIFKPAEDMILLFCCCISIAIISYEPQAQTGANA